MMKCFLIFVFIIQSMINLTISDKTTVKPEDKGSDLNPLADILFDGIPKQPESEQTNAPHSRVKRQYYDYPYYRRYPYYPIPIPIIIGGFGGGFGFGGRGFGGFGGRGFGGFGGRGFGGFGGRGFGGFGGRGFGGFGGGRGGRG